MGSRNKNKYSREYIESIVKECKTISDFCRKLGFQPRGGNYKLFYRYVQEYNLDISHFTGYTPHSKKTRSDEYLCENSYKITSNRLLKKLIEEGKKEVKCECCGLSEWNGKQIPLELHHINGDHHDNRFENLMAICPNCHAQTDNYCGRGRKWKKGETQQRFCQECGKEISVSSKSGLCVKCQHKLMRKTEWPTKEKLIELNNKHSKVKIGKMFGVSDNAVRKWLKYYDIE